MQKTVLITGASQGIGWACAQEFLQHTSFDVIITSRSNQNLSIAKMRLIDINSNWSARITTIICDQSISTDIDILVDRLKPLAIKHLILISNVGINIIYKMKPRRIQAISYSILHETITTNITNTFYLLSKILVLMKRNKCGQIILIGSQAYKKGVPGQALYNTSKSALFGLMKTVANEYFSLGISCNLINPGLVDTNRTKKIQQKLIEKENVAVVSPEKIAQYIVSFVNKNNLESSGIEFDI